MRAGCSRDSEMTGTRDRRVGYQKLQRKKVAKLLSVLISRTIGSQTAGVDRDIVNRMMLLSFDVPFSGLGVFYADGTAAQRTGVKIDRIIHPIVKGIRAGRDEVLGVAWQMANEP